MNAKKAPSAGLGAKRGAVSGKSRPRKTGKSKRGWQGQLGPLRRSAQARCLIGPRKDKTPAAESLLSPHKHLRMSRKFKLAQAPSGGQTNQARSRLIDDASSDTPRGRARDFRRRHSAP